MIVGLAVVMVAVWLFAEQAGADEIDGEAEHRDRDRLAIGDRDRIDQPLHALEARSGSRSMPRMTALAKAARSPNLPVPKLKCELRACLRAKQIGKRGDAERRGMGRHVPAVGQQRHRAEQRSCHDFADHHDRGQRDHEPGAALVARVFRTEEHVVVGPSVEGMRVHGCLRAQAAPLSADIALRKTNTITAGRPSQDGLSERETQLQSTPRSDGFRFAQPILRLLFICPCSRLAEVRS